MLSLFNNNFFSEFLFAIFILLSIFFIVTCKGSRLFSQSVFIKAFCSFPVFSFINTLSSFKILCDILSYRFFFSAAAEAEKAKRLEEKAIEKYTNRMAKIVEAQEKAVKEALDVMSKIPEAPENAAEAEKAKRLEDKAFKRYNKCVAQNKRAEAEAIDEAYESLLEITEAQEKAAAAKNKK